LGELHQTFLLDVSL